MNILIESPSWVLTAAVIMVLAILATLGLLKYIRKRVSAVQLRKSHDVVGFTFSIIGVLYSVILGFTVINAQDRYNTVLQTIHTEAIILADLYQDSSYFSYADCTTIRANIRSYVDHVINEEWWEKKPKQINFQSRNYVKAIWDSYYHIQLQDEKIKIWYTESISKLNNFTNARLSRQFNSWEHLGGLMWSILIVGAVITICFMFFFGLESMRSHMLMTSLLVGYLTFMLYLVYTLDHVKKGPQAIQPTAFEQVRNLFNEWDGNL